MAKYKPWTAADKDVLTKHFTSRGTAYVAEQLGRTKGSVSQRAAQLKLPLPPTNHYWSALELDTLCRLYEAGASVGEVSAALPLRSVRVISWKAKQLQLQRHKPAPVAPAPAPKPTTAFIVEWSAAEVTLLRQRFPHEPTATLAQELGRSEAAVKTKARTLGLAKSDALAAEAAAEAAQARLVKKKAKAQVQKKRAAAAKPTSRAEHLRGLPYMHPERVAFRERHVAGKRPVLVEDKVRNYVVFKPLRP